MREEQDSLLDFFLPMNSLSTTSSSHCTRVELVPTPRSLSVPTAAGAVEVEGVGGSAGVVVSSCVCVCVCVTGLGLAVLQASCASLVSMARR